MNHSRKAAVVLAVDHFDDEGIPNLEFAEEDGRQWMGFLQYRLMFDDVQGLFGKGLKKDDAMDLIEARARALSRAGGGTFWVVYAGHAVLRDEGRQLLLCPRVRRSLLSGGIEDHTIPIEQIRMQTAFPGVDRVIVPDACRSPLETGTRDVGELETGMRGLRDMVPLKGGVVEGGWGVLCACSDREKAQELKALRRGLFSHTAMQLWDEDLRAGREVRLTHGFVDRINAAMARVAEAEKLSRRQHAWLQLNFPAPVLRVGQGEARDVGEPQGIEMAPRPSLADRVAARRAAQRRAFEADWQEYVTARARLGAAERRELWIELCQSHGVEPGTEPGDLEWTADGVRRVVVVAAPVAPVPRPAPTPAPAPVPSPTRAPRIGDVFRTDIGMELLWIPAGKFRMGSPEGVGDDAERPQTEVTISRPFWMGKYPVRQRDWTAVMGDNPSDFEGEDLPVESVDWNQCVEFGRKLTERMKGKVPEGYEFRLPTEAEWEYACRAGTTTQWSFGNEESAMERYGWYDKNAGGQTQPVGQKLGNAWGLHDMHGNVWEWCLDWWGSYPGGRVTDPKGPATGSYRVGRGGSWYDSARCCRSAVRDGGIPGHRRDLLGFRLVLAPRSGS
jgi:formylglycine-generating enzyme required for sulfatase activity